MFSTEVRALMRGYERGQAPCGKEPPFDLPPAAPTFPARLADRPTARAIMKPHPGLNKEQLGGVVTILNLVLADECLLYTKTRNCHGTAAGLELPPLQRLLEQDYDKLSDLIEQVADRMWSLGAPAMGTMSEFLQYTRLRELPGGHPPARRMIAHLLDDHESMTRTLRGDRVVCAEEFSDVETGGFLTGFLQQHEEMARSLRAHLENS